MTAFKCLVLSAFCIFAMVGTAAMAEDEGKIPATIEDLWKGYDPEALPLDVQLLEQWEQDGVALKKVFFTSEIWQGEPVRVYAIYGYPLGKTNLPGVLHIHGGGGTVSLTDVLFWAKRGYAAATFDHLGKQYDRTIYTRWGKVNFPPTYGAYKDDPREDTYYHAVIASMRTITLLSHQPEVDPKRIGAYGISYGGCFIWMVSALDKRLKCVAPLVGSGTPPESWDSDSYRRWSKFYNSYMYADKQLCPLLFLNGTDDFNARMDFADATFKRVNTDKRQAYEANYNHRLEPAVVGNLPMWMDTYLKGAPAWPKSPELAVTLGTNGVPLARVKADASQPIEQVTVHYNLDAGAAPPARHWRSVEGSAAERRFATGGASEYQAAMPVFDNKADIRVYCDVYYRRGIVLSSVMTKLAPSTLGDVHPTLEPQTLIDDFANGKVSDWSCYPSGPDPIARNPLIIPSVYGPDGAWAMMGSTVVTPGGTSIGTAKIFDPQFRPGTHKLLKVQLRAAAGTELAVIMSRDFWGTKPVEYRAEVKIPAFDDWTRIELQAGDFKTKEGQLLDNWDNLQYLRFESKYPAEKAMLISRVEWGD